MRMRPADDDAAEADDGDLRRAATDVDDEAAGRLADRQAGADRGRHGLLDEARPAGAGVERGVPDGALLDLGDAGRDAEQHPRPRDQPDPVVHLVHEVLDHLLGDVEVADDAVAQRADRDDVGRRPADHALGLRADRQHALRLGVDGDDAGLADDDAAVADVDQGVGRAEVDPDVAGEQAEEASSMLGCNSLLVDAGPGTARGEGRPGGRGGGRGSAARTRVPAGEPEADTGPRLEPRTGPENRRP